MRVTNIPAAMGRVDKNKVSRTQRTQRTKSNERQSLGVGNGTRNNTLNTLHTGRTSY